MVVVIALIIIPNFILVERDRDFIVSKDDDFYIPDNFIHQPDVERLIKNAPKAFTENRGQLENDEVWFYAQDGSVWFTDDGVWFELREYAETRGRGSQIRGQDGVRVTPQTHTLYNSPNSQTPTPIHSQTPTQKYKRVILKQEFIGANQVRPIGRERLNCNSNFFYGNDSSKWCSDVPNYNEIYYENLYDGIDLRYYTNENELKYDFIVHPGANLGQIRVRYEGADGIEIDGSGNVKIKTQIEDIIDHNLFIYQNYDYKRHQIDGSFKILNNLEYGFEILQNYNEQEVLVIDPKVTLNYSTFIGGSGGEWGWDLAMDQIGNLYISGFTDSPDFPNTTGAYDRNLNGDADIFVIKLDKDYIINYSTYIGGDNFDLFSTIAVKSNGDAFITGWTNSSDFPTTPGVYDRIIGGSDVFVLKLDSSGSDLLYSTFVGGSDNDMGMGCITIDSMGNAFVTGFTLSLDFPTTPGAYDRTYNGGGVYDDDAFIFKLDQTGSKLIYSTYIGGNKSDRACDIAIDSMGNSYVTGLTNSSDFPTTDGAYDTSINGIYDVFVLKLNQNGTSLIYSTYFGGKKIDWGRGISLDSIGNVYITGETDSADFPNTTGAYDQTYNNNIDFDGFVFKLNHNGSKLIFSTFIGGTGYDRTRKITYDLTGNLYVVGDTGSYDFPTTDDAFDSTLNPYDIFLIKLSSNGSNLLYSTFIGGSDHDFSTSIVSDSIGNVYITGVTSSLDFPNTTGKYNGDIEDAFIFKFSVPKNININSLSLIFNNTPVNRVYSRLDSYNFRVNITDPISLTDLGIVRLNLDPQRTNIQLLWNRATGQFTKSNDPNNFITLEPTSSAKNKHIYLSLSQWIINFNITFNWNYPDENFHDVQAYATSATLSPAWFNATGLYCVENDLDFNGTLSVNNENNRTITDGELVRGGEKLNWTGLKVVYENTTNVYPPNEEYNVTIWNARWCIGINSSSSGMNFTFQTVTDKNTNINGDTHIINLSGIPPECDKTNVTFIIRIDGDNVSFSDPIPDNTTWQTTSDVKVSVNITDIGGGLVNGSSVMYSLSIDNGETWNDWQTFPELQSKVSVEPEEVIIFNDGTNNLIKWKANDSVGNGPVESPEYQILVDTEIIEFSNASPLSTNVSTAEEVEVGITITDKTSGVNASSIEYKISNDWSKTWTSWVPVLGLSNDKIVNITLKLTFPNGTANRIKWRASDIAGNGPTESESYPININTWQEKISKPKVQLWTPPNSSIIPITSVELTWRLESIDAFNITYNVFLDTVYPPIELNKSNLLDTSLKVNGLSNKQTYYWTVIPRRGTINGTCESGVWSFTVDVPIPKVKLLTPENGSIIKSVKPTLSWSVDYTGTEILKYDVYLDTREDPGMEHKGYSSKYYLPKKLLENGKTYYWKVVPWAGDVKGLESEIWSFTVGEIDEIPRFDLELRLEPSVIELEPGSIKYVIANVTNLGDLTDPISVYVITPPNVKLGVFVNEPRTRDIVSGDNADFNLTIVTLEDAKKGEVMIEVAASSNKALEYDLVVEKQEKLTIRILGEEKAKQEKSSYLFVFLNILILIIIIIIILAVAIFIQKRKKKEEEEQEKATPEAVMVKPGELPTTEISIGSAPKPEQLPKITEPEKVTEVISPEVPKPQLPGTTPEQERSKGQQTPQLPPGDIKKNVNEMAETGQGSSEETTNPQESKNEPITPNY